MRAARTGIYVQFGLQSMQWLSGKASIALHGSSRLGLARKDCVEGALAWTCLYLPTLLS